MTARRVPAAATQALVLVAACLWVSVVRMGTRVPNDRDVDTYAVMGHELLHGKRLYADTFDQKPPAVYVTFALAERAAGYGPQAITFLYLLASFLTLAGLARFSATLGPGRAALVPVVIGAFALTALHLEATEANSEIFMNACLAWVAAVCAAPPALSGRRLIGAALLTALASLYKHVGVAPGALMIAARVGWDAAAWQDWKGGVRRAAGAGAVVGGAWAATFLYFAATGRARLFAVTMTRLNVGYAGLNGGWLAKVLPRFLDTLRYGAIIPVLVVAAAVAFAGLLTLVRARRRTGVVLMAYLLGATAAVVLPGRLTMHYFQLLVPPVALAAGAVLAFAAERGRPHVWAPTAAAAALLVAGFAADSVAALRVRGAALQALYGDQPPAAVAALERLVPPPDTFFAWGRETWLYFDTGRRPPTPVLWADQARTSALATPLARRVVSDLTAHPPAIVVVARWLPPQKIFGNPVGRWIAANYAPLPGQDYGAVYFLARRR